MPPDRHSDRKQSHATSSGAASSGAPSFSADRDSSAVRSVKKKIETLKRETSAALRELEELESRKRKWKQRVKGSADTTKAEFLRAASSWRRKLDEHTDELVEVRAAIEKTLPELEECRRKLKEMGESTSARRAEMEREHKERLAEIRREIDILNPEGSA